MVINTLKPFTKTTLNMERAGSNKSGSWKQRFEQRNSGGLIKVNIDGGDMMEEQIGEKHVNETF